MLYEEKINVSAMRSVCKKRCVFSPSMEREGDILWLVVLSLCHPSFGCQMGELRTGSSGWMHKRAEVLEFLTFWRIGTAGCSLFSNLASSIWKILLSIPFRKIY